MYAQQGDPGLAEMLRARIAERMHWLEVTPITAATQADLPRDTIRNIFRRDSALPRADTLVAIAKALDTSVSYLVGETVDPGIGRWADPASLEEAVRAAKPVPIRAYVADAWLTPPTDPIGYVDVNVEGFETADLSAFLVNDDSASRVYEKGRIVIVAPSNQIGIRLGDHTISVRVRGKPGQEEVETTIKEFAITPSGESVLESLGVPPLPPVQISQLQHLERRSAGIIVADYRPRLQIAAPNTFFPSAVAGPPKKKRGRTTT